MTKSFPHSLLAGLLVVSLAACSSGDGGKGLALTSVLTPKSKLEPKAFGDCGAYRDYYAASLSKEILEGWYGCWGCDVVLTSGAPAAAESFTAGAPPPSAGGDSNSPGFQDVSGTNTQEAGIDEADLIEADLRGYFYVARNGEVLVVRSSPADDLAVVARVPLATSGYAWIHGLYLDEANQRLVVLAASGPDYGAGGSYPARSGTGALFLDVSDPNAPQAVDWLWTEGWLVDSRRVDDRVHLVASHYFAMPQALSQDQSFWQLVTDYYVARNDKRTNDAEGLAAQVRSRVESAVRDAELSELLPLQKSGFGSEAAEPIACESIIHADVEHRMAMLLITSVDTDGSSPARLATVNNAWQLYASRDYLYLAQGSGGWWFDVRQRQQTAIYRFRLTGEAVEPAGFGLVDGHTLNSYSFGEHDGYLRVATTEARFQPGADRWRLSNSLFVLGEGADGNLETVGEARDFLPDKDERIFSSRFLGDRGYVVTFRQVDPLFVFDLSDPERPVAAGQVEIPGFSTYIHPLDADHLLTIGRDGDGNGVNNNIRLQVFDVSDPAAPALSHFYVPPVGEDDWVFSVASYDPHAFTYWPAEKLLSIPLQVGSPETDNAFSGFLALQVDLDTGFTPLARIDHKLEGQGGSGCPDSANGDAAPCQTFAPVYYNPPLRSVVGVEGERTVLYTLSQDLLRAADLADLETGLDSLELTAP